MKYGITIMRAQPFHNGHQSIIEQIIKDGLNPIIIIGSAQEFGTEKNPLHTLDREKIIKLVFPNIKILHLHDNKNWDYWMIDLLKTLSLGLDEDFMNNSVIYTCNKEEDRLDFTYNGKEFKNEFYSKCFEEKGLKTKNLEEGFSNVEIRATEIRKDLEKNKHFLNYKVYEFIKELRKL